MAIGRPTASGQRSNGRATIATMPKSPPFSTYRQAEDRVTASLMAVFERIDPSNLERQSQSSVIAR